MGARAAKALMRISNRLRTLAARHMSTSADGQRSGVFARTWPIGTTAIWIAILLTSYVFVYYL